MIKARSGDLVIFGLSRENMARLQAGQPIAFDGDQVGITGTRILIMFGETETEIVRELAEASSGGKA